VWLIARRSFSESWGRLFATLLAALFSIALIGGTVQFSLRAEDAVSGGDASEYFRADVVVQGGSVDPDDARALPNGEVRLDEVAGEPGVAAVAGDIVVPVIAAGAGGNTIVAPAGARTLLRPWVTEPTLNPYRLEAGRAPTADHEVALMRHLAEAGSLKPGDTIAVGLPRRTRQMTVVGIVTVQDSSVVAAGGLVLAPPETARREAGLADGTWHSVWVKAAPGVAAEQLRDTLKRSLAESTATVRTAKDVRDSQASGLAAQGLEISGGIGMLTGVAVFVGLFVVANTFGGLIRQRTRRLAMLSAIGATPEQVKALIRLEALALGLVASAGGALLGYPVADALIRLFAHDGFDISAAEAPALWLTLPLSIIGGVLVTQLAVFRAARRAARIAPMQALRESSSERTERPGRRILAGTLILLSSFIYYGPVPAVLNDGPPGLQRTQAITAIIGCGSMVVACALAVFGPLLVRPVGGLIGLIGQLLGGESGRLARATITRNPRRVSAAAASLMLAVALATTALLIVVSANTRFDQAANEVMLARHAVSTSDKTPDGLRPLPRDLAARIEQAPGVTQAAALSTAKVKLISPPPRAYQEGERLLPLYLKVTGADPATLPQVLRLPGNLPALAPGEIALPSVTMRAQRLRVGQGIVVRGANGDVPLTIAGTYHDPTHVFADGALVAEPTMRQLDPNAGAQVVLVSGGTAAAIAEKIAGVPGATVLHRTSYVDKAAAAITEGSTVIYGFIGMTLLLALFGMTTTISMSVSERRREFGLLGAVGATTRQLRAIIHWEAATVVTLGTLLGLGIAVGTVALIHTATGSSYIQPNAPWWLYASVTGAAALITLITSALPARRATTVPILEVARAE
jgi:putative ABC transport system permease protein